MNKTQKKYFLVASVTFYVRDITATTEAEAESGKQVKPILCWQLLQFGYFHSWKVIFITLVLESAGKVVLSPHLWPPLLSKETRPPWLLMYTVVVANPTTPLCSPRSLFHTRESTAGMWLVICNHVRCHASHGRGQLWRHHGPGLGDYVMVAFTTRTAPAQRPS